MQLGDVIELSIHGVASSGDGVGRVTSGDGAGSVVFVPRTAPGDLVRVRLVEKKKSFARAEVIEVVTASADRVTPRCELFVDGSCGGCSWQHLSLTAQHAGKLDLVTRALRRAIAAGLVMKPVLAAAPAYGWRRRARLHVDGGLVGFRGARSSRVVTVTDCPQLEPGLLPALAAVVAADPPDGELSLLRGYQGDVVVRTDRDWPAGANLVGHANIVGVSAGGASYGASDLELEAGQRAGAGDFAQASLDGNRRLREVVVAAVGTSPGRLLELYAGAGNLTRELVSHGWEVTATDMVAPVHTHPAAKFVAGPAEQVVPRLLADGVWQVVLLDPPRTGAAAVMPWLARAKVARVVYVSCDAATLARDLDVLLAAGFVPLEAVSLDLMPQTAHVETVVTLERR